MRNKARQDQRQSSRLSHHKAVRFEHESEDEKDNFASARRGYVLQASDLILHGYAPFPSRRVADQQGPWTGHDG